MYPLIGSMKDFHDAHAFSRCSNFITPEIIKVTFGFVMFSGHIKREHWEERSQAF